MNVRVIILIYDSVTEWSWQHDWLTSTNWYKRFESLITDHNLIMEKSLKWQTQALTRTYNAWTIQSGIFARLSNARTAHLHRTTRTRYQITHDMHKYFVRIVCTMRTIVATNQIKWAFHPTEYISIIYTIRLSNQTHRRSVFSARLLGVQTTRLPRPIKLHTSTTPPHDINCITGAVWYVNFYSTIVSVIKRNV